MSMTINNQEDFRRVQRLVWGKLFGLFIQKGREKRGCTVEEVARLAGMETSEWLAVEAGCVPDPRQLRPMADALALGYDKIAMLAVLCRDAWEQ